ncbi:MatE protein [Selenomonas ruminantium]|uniref:MatE protein n=1 Tax=Selenomonas ruminantium TaxID=971 RepID=A0A1M6SUV2_SELRU|nr:MATE family efflux transporter [Selenomonas ruminantium]SHK48504.1 MatE protein [Selenomonas ruminantium]
MRFLWSADSSAGLFVQGKRRNGAVYRLPRDRIVKIYQSGPEGLALSRFLGLEAMGAFQLTLPLVFLVMMLSQVISLGVQSNCAKSIGGGRQEEARGIYSLALLFCLPLSSLLGLGIFWGAGELSLLLGAGGGEPAVAQALTDYLRGMAPGMALLLFLPMQISVLFLEGQAQYALRAIFV